MSAPSLTSIMAGIETRLQTITGLRTNDVVPGQTVPPYAWVGVPDIPDYFTTFGRGHWEIRPTITVVVSSAHDRAGQLALAGYADHTGTSSIPAALEADDTLGGIVEYCHVRSFGPQAIELGLVTYFGGVFVLEAGAQGT